MSESTTESNNPKPLSDRIFLIIMAKYDVLFNKVNPVWKRITKLDSDYQIVTRARFGAIVLFPCVYLYIILHRLSEHNFEYLKACTKKDDTKYIDLFIIEPCLFYDVACGFFFLFLLIDVGQKLIKRYKITNNQFVFLLVLELSYCIVRGQSWNDYALTHFERWTSLYYADIIWLFGLYLIFFKCLMTGIQTLIKCLSDTIVAKKEKLTYKSPISNATPENILTENNNQGFQQSVKTDTSPSINKGIKGLLYDKKSKDDTLHRKPFAEQLANRILATNNPEGSVAVAVTGEWASGKSTFLGYIREYLEGEAIIIDMNAGATESKRLLVKDFFDTIAEELQSYDAAVSELVYDYVDSLLEVHENGIIKVLKKVFAFNKTNSTKERFKTLSGCIKQLHQPLIIFIDDLDRLDKKETKEVLRLIRNTANFSNVIYIVAFDKDYVIAQIKTDHDETGKYLDKLFQLEVSLPFYESNKVTDYLFKVLEERYSSDKEKVSIGVLKSQAFIGDFVKSYREAHRLVNSFSVIYDWIINGDSLEREVDFCDLFLLEIIRLTDFGLYDEIYTSGSISSVMKGEAELDALNANTLKTSREKFLPIFQFWTKARVLGGVEIKRRLENSTYFDFYFRLRYADGQISARLLQEVVREGISNEDAYEIINQYSEENKARFVRLAMVSNVKFSIAQIETILYIFSILHEEEQRDLQKHLEVIRAFAEFITGSYKPLPLNLNMFTHINHVFLSLFRLPQYQEYFNDKVFVKLLIKYLDKWVILEMGGINVQTSDTIVVLKFINELKSRMLIENEYPEIACRYVKFFSQNEPELKDTWVNIEVLIKNSTGKVLFVDILERYIFDQRENLLFFIKQLFLSTFDETDYVLCSDVVDKVWGDEESFKAVVIAKQVDCKVGIKPILQQLSTLLNESRPITEAVLREEQYRELRILEKEDEYW
jgi:hypothetical protein